MRHSRKESHFPVKGIAIESDWHTEQTAVTEINLGTLRKTRVSGKVTPMADRHHGTYKIHHVYKAKSQKIKNSAALIHVNFFRRWSFRKPGHSDNIASQGNHKPSTSGNLNVSDRNGEIFWAAECLWVI